MDSDAYMVECLKDPKRANEGMRLLLRNYGPRLYGLLRPMCQSHEDTDEVLQRTLIKAWKGAASFRGESQMYTWLHRIALREAWTFLKREKKSLSMQGMELGEAQSTASQSSTEIQQLFLQSLAQLPSRQRLVFLLRYYEEMPFETMAGITGTSEGSLKASFHHAKHKIQAFLKAQA